MPPADASQETLMWFYAILFVGIPAVFGGVLQVCYKLTYGSLFSEEQHRMAGHEPRKTKWEFARDLLFGGLFGLGGGAAVVLAAILLKKFDMPTSNDNKLYLIVLGVVAGFIGYRILPRVARGLEERMDITEKDSRRALDDAKKAASDAEIARKKAEEAVKNAEKAQSITYAISLIETKAYRKAEKILLDLRKTYGLDVLIHWKLSNLYKRKGDYNSAVNLTNKYIEDLRAAKMESDPVYAVALYNSACYTTLKAMGPPRDDVLLAKALDDLKRAIDLDQVRREYAWEDDDFKILKEETNPRFAEIVGREYQ